MRFGIIALAALAYGASAACAASSTDGGSLEALLNRIADQHDGHEVANSSPAGYAGDSTDAASLQANASIRALIPLSLGLAGDGALTP